MSLHGLIMNLPCKSWEIGPDGHRSYEFGHRDARHAAAELALAADAEIERLRGQRSVLAKLLGETVAVCRTVEPGEGGIVEAEMLDKLIDYAEKAICDVANHMRGTE